MTALFGGDAMPSRTIVQPLPAGATAPDALLQPSSLAVRSARVRLAALAVGSERDLLIGPVVVRCAPWATPLDPCALPARPVVLRI